MVIKNELMKYADKDRAKKSLRFFKTGKGEYGEGDLFLGIRTKELRRVAKKFDNLDFDNLQKALNGNSNDERFTALVILVNRMKRAKGEEKERIVEFYLNNVSRVNNWNLVDVSAYQILGNFLIDKADRGILEKLANSKDLWERRISVVSTFAFIRRGEFEDNLRISKILLKDPEDLIHKAVGWMLREVGKKNRKILENFLKENYDELPRTTLRYAIEKFSFEERKQWLNGSF